MTAAACILCGHREARLLFRSTDRLNQTTSDVFSVVACRHCGLARLDPIPTDLSRFYPTQYWFAGGPANLYRRLVLRHHVHIVRSALGHRAPRHRQRVLDAGSGGGLLAAMLREEGIQATALDLALAAAQIARRAGAPAVSADFARAPFADSSWDVIALFHMLEHVPDPGAHLRSAHRLLAAGGHLVVAVPNFASLQRRIFGLRWNGLDVPRHLHHFRLRDLQALLEQSGFQITRTRYFSWRDSPAGLATTLAPSLDPMRSRAAFPAAYALLTALCVPLALLEAALHRGSTLIVEAKRV